MLNRFDFERAVAASELAAQDRLILLMITITADWPGGKTSAKHTKSLTELASMTGLHRATVARSLNRLEAAGWVRRKRPTKERAQSMKECTQYRLVAPAGTSRHERLETSRQERLDPPPTSRPPQPELVADSDTTSRPVRHKPDLFQTFPDQAAARESPRRNNTDPAVLAIAEKTGATTEEAEVIVKRIRTEKQPRNLMALIWKMATDGDLAQMLTEYRDVRRKERIAAELKALRRKPMCLHGEQGGAERHPATGQPLCPLCRRNIGQVSA